MPKTSRERADIVVLERRRDRPGGRFRLFFTDEEQARAWQRIAKPSRSNGRYVPRSTIEDGEMDALELLGVAIRIEEAG